MAAMNRNRNVCAFSTRRAEKRRWKWARRRDGDHSRALRTQSNWRVPNLIGPTSRTSEAELSQRLQPGTSAKIFRNFSTSHLSLAKRLRRSSVPTKIQARPEPRKKHFAAAWLPRVLIFHCLKLSEFTDQSFDLRKIQTIIFKFENDQISGSRVTRKRVSFSLLKLFSSFAGAVGALLLEDVVGVVVLEGRTRH